MSTQNDLRAGTVALPLDRFPVVSTRALMKEAIEHMTRRGIGIACLVSDADHTFAGVFTDGDLRRTLLRSQKPLPALLADDVMLHAKAAPLTIAPDAKLIDAVRLMEEKGVWDLPVVKNGRLVGLLHLHPAIKQLMSA